MRLKTFLQEELSKADKLAKDFEDQTHWRANAETNKKGMLMPPVTPRDTIIPDEEPAPDPELEDELCLMCRQFQAVSTNGLCSFDIRGREAWSKDDVKRYLKANKD